MNKKAQSAQDLDDIRLLQKTPAFERYFIRRLEERKATFRVAILEDDGLTAEEREIHRRIYQEYSNILSLTKQDEVNAKKLLNYE